LWPNGFTFIKKYFEIMQLFLDTGVIELRKADGKPPSNVTLRPTEDNAPLISVRALPDFLPGRAIFLAMCLLRAASAGAYYVHYRFSIRVPMLSWFN
jgi:hypothetical protein